MKEMRVPTVDCFLEKFSGCMDCDEEDLYLVSVDCDHEQTVIEGFCDSCKSSWRITVRVQEA